LDEKTAHLLEACEGRLVKAKGLLAAGDKREAERVFVQAKTLAQEAVEAGRAEVTIPGSLPALKNWKPHPRGYWGEQ
jgi:hypothetical protein